MDLHVFSSFFESVAPLFCPFKRWDLLYGPMLQVIYTRSQQPRGCSLSFRGAPTDHVVFKKRELYIIRQHIRSGTCFCYETKCVGEGVLKVFSGSKKTPLVISFSTKSFSISAVSKAIGSIVLLLCGKP